MLPKLRAKPSPARSNLPMVRPAAIDKLAALLQEHESRASQVARLLHDEVGPTLCGIGFLLQASGVPSDSLAPVLEYLDQAMTHVRAASTTLQSNVVERSGLPLALQLLAERAGAGAGYSITLVNQSTRRFPPATAHALYQIASLALDNACRHASPSTVTITLTDTTLEVRDNGSGFDISLVRISPPGAGIVRMESYARLANLKLRLDSSPGQGTIVGTQTI